LNIELWRVSYEFIGVEKVKGPMAGRKYILGSGNGVRRQAETESGVPESSESPYRPYRS
jgi:hypothetical protein